MRVALIKDDEHSRRLRRAYPSHDWRRAPQAAAALPFSTWDSGGNSISTPFEPAAQFTYERSVTEACSRSAMLMPI